MNTANLQMEGLLLALAALCVELKRKDILSERDIGAALDLAESGASARLSELRDANTEAIHFPIRFLRQALSRGDGPLDYRAITATIGRLRDERP
ncbi:hypothetical protein BN1110_05691 [bacterium YEK0313]|nr:hypothetical protein BN1110_05691 [bacterium YEK0313]